MSSLNIGDVVVISRSGWGFLDEDIGKSVELVSTEVYFGGLGFHIKPYDCKLNTDVWGCVGVESFGDSPLVLLNVFEEQERKASIAKPILEERKIGKIRMELVDQGFPNALLELAKVMTWANQNKGYKDHDWKNIPNAENAFKGAAARHRVKFDAQRSFGNEMLDCTDEESGIIHLAHELFNTMALLELALVGKVK